MVVVAFSLGGGRGRGRGFSKCPMFSESYLYRTGAKTAVMRSSDKDRVVVAPQPSRLWYKAVKMLQPVAVAENSCGVVVLVCDKIMK